VSDDASATLAPLVVQLADRAAAEAFIADDPLNRAGVYAKTDIRRWSNSFLKRAADYQRKGYSSTSAPDRRLRCSAFLCEALARA